MLRLRKPSTNSVSEVWLATWLASHTQWECAHSASPPQFVSGPLKNEERKREGTWVESGSELRGRHDCGRSLVVKVGKHHRCAQ